MTILSLSEEWIKLKLLYTVLFIPYGRYCMVLTLYTQMTLSVIIILIAILDSNRLVRLLSQRVGDIIKSILDGSICSSR